MPRNYSTKRMAAENEFCTIYHFPAPLASVIWLRAANVILPCADLEPAPDEVTNNVGCRHSCGRIDRMQEFAEMGYAIICKPCSNSTLNLQLALEARISRHLSLRGRGMRGCKAVEGKISPMGWCNLFQPKGT